MLTLVDLKKHYRRGDTDTVALAGISLSIPKGQFVSIMGPSGSGKSTLLHLIGTLDVATFGRITVLDQDLAQMSDHELTLFRRQRLGFVFQFFNLMPTMNALENAALPGLLCGMKASAAYKRSAELLDAVGLSKRMHHKPDQLSGGEMQRVAIARALMNQPGLILADEPTGNLDTATGHEILRILRQAARERDVTVLMVTHDAQAAQVGDRLIRLRDGHLVGDEAIDVSSASVSA